ncbi:MAG: right-handed parallel beta-helix repeat-containing protein [Aeromicrobium sp.]
MDHTAAANTSQLKGAHYSWSRRLLRRSAAVVVLVLVVAGTHPPLAVAVNALDTAADRFERQVTGGWGDASQGGTYEIAGDRSRFVVDGAEGGMRLTSRARSGGATLPKVSLTDVDVRFRALIDSRARGGGYWVWAVGRQNANGEYRAGFYLAATGLVSAYIRRTLPGASRWLTGGVPLPRLHVRAGRHMWVRMQIVGQYPTVIRVKVWLAGSREPARWSATATDWNPSLSGAGAIGVRAHFVPSRSGQQTLVMIDDLRAGPADTGETPPAPTPVPTPQPTARPTSVPTPAPTAVPTASPVPAPPNSFHVSTSGNDSNPGSQQAPWRTLQKAANSVPAGGTVVVHSGTYEGFTMSRSGSSTQPIVFRGAASEARPVIDGTLGARLDVVRFAGVHDIQFRGFVVQNAQGSWYSGSGVRTDSGAYAIVIEDNVIRENQSWGINVHTSHDVTVRGNDISGSAAGIQVTYAGEGTLIVDNDVHGNNRMLRNTPTSVDAHDDAGGIGIAFDKSTGHVVARGNSIWGNRAQSYDYGTDGSAFEIFAASNVTMTDNEMWDSENIFESGTYQGGPSCNDNVFARNTAYGATTQGHTWGMFLRCGSNMLIANNSFVDIDGFVFAIGYDSSRFSHSLDGLRVMNNIVSMNTGAKIFALTTALPSSVVIDYNLASTTGTFASLPDGRTTTSGATFTSWTGYQTHGATGDPGFVNRAARDYRLSTGSPAIDRGTTINGVIDSWSGAAPDIGRFERAP